MRDLADLAGTSAMTVTRFENDSQNPSPETLLKIQRALEKAGVVFTYRDGDGVRLTQSAACARDLVDIAQAPGPGAERRARAVARIDTYLSDLAAWSEGFPNQDTRQYVSALRERLEAVIEGLGPTEAANVVDAAMEALEQRGRTFGR